MLERAPNAAVVGGSKAVGEPPFFLGGIVFFAIRDAVSAARKEHQPDAKPHFTFCSPATSERIRMACADKIAVQAMGSEAPADGDALPCRGSF